MTAASLDARSRTEVDAPLGDIALVDLLDRLLGAGVLLAGDIVISLAGVDLVEVRLHALIMTIRAEESEDD
jgi:hypothetical protein